jgi:predicted nicotinamide N-methyase
MASSPDPHAFILANTVLLAPPLVPEIRLRLAHEALPLWEKTEEELGALGLPPPFWAFAWAGGQALARYILDNPELVARRSVLDFASGSGLVAIAAMRAGASLTLASEIDGFALAAIATNAEANGVAVAVSGGDLIGSDAGWDVVLVGDAFYEKPLADRLLRLARCARPARRARAHRRSGPDIPAQIRPHSARQLRSPVTRALEDAEIKRTGVWELVLGS